MLSSWLGLFGTMARILLVYPAIPSILTKRLFYVNKQTIRWSIIFLTVTMIVSLILGKTLEIKPINKPLIEYVIVSIILAPIFEELLNRGILFNFLIKQQGERKLLKPFILSIWLGFAFILPDALFKTINFVTDKPDYSIPLLIITTIIFNYALMYFNKKENKKSIWIYIIYCFFIQGLIFTMMHKERMSWSNLISGFIFGVAFYASNSLIPAIVCHSAANIITLLFQLRII